MSPPSDPAAALPHILKTEGVFHAKSKTGIQSETQKKQDS
jgi:hypothetical protein